MESGSGWSGRYDREIWQTHCASDHGSTVVDACMGERAAYISIICVSLCGWSGIGDRVWYIPDIQADHVARIFRDQTNSAAGVDPDRGLVGRYYG